MKGILVVGSIAYDDVETHKGRRMNQLGGSASYFALSASHFVPIHIVACVGNDFTQGDFEAFTKKNICTKGLETLPGKTFRWKGTYLTSSGQAQNLETQFNVFSTFNPSLPEEYRELDYVFLAAIHPELQERVLAQMIKPSFVVLDTRECFIRDRLDSLRSIIKKADLFLLNEDESFLLTGYKDPEKALAKMHELGPRYIVLKQGKEGAVFSYDNNQIKIPIYDDVEVFDRTGAGDAFAGGLLGYITEQNTLNNEVIQKGVLCGAVMASFAIESFGIERLLGITRHDINERFMSFEKSVSM
jgi:sugar/nucleoside kinase (ribokinase family)